MRMGQDCLCDRAIVTGILYSRYCFWTCWCNVHSGQKCNLLVSMRLDTTRQDFLVVSMTYYVGGCAVPYDALTVLFSQRSSTMRHASTPPIYPNNLLFLRTALSFK